MIIVNVHDQPRFSRSRRFLTGASVLLLGAGCASTSVDRAARSERGYVYYLDGAGGGKAWSNWSGGVRDGLTQAGYAGAGEMFAWETGLGLTADQMASNEYKRGKAAELAQKIQQRARDYPSAPVNLIGLSAGTAIAVFALEALPPGAMVDNVVLLSGSLSSTHDLSAALLHVRGKMHIFTSQRDPVLRMMLPLAGTADRGSGTVETIGVQGARLPSEASAETRRLYASKVVVIPRNEEFARYGDRGGHIEAVRAPFVQHFVAPLLSTTPATTIVAVAPGAGQIENPDFRRWADFPPGAWVIFEGSQTVGGVRQAVRIKATLISKSPESLIVEREYLPSESTAAPITNRRLFLTAVIDPKRHPMVHPDSKVQTLPDERVLVGRRALDCEVKSVTASGEFPDWGRNVRGKVWGDRAIPGGIVRIEMSSVFDGQQVEFAATVSDWQAGKEIP